MCREKCINNANIPNYVLWYRLRQRFASSNTRKAIFNDKNMKEDWLVCRKTRSVFSVWILNQKGLSNPWSNLLEDPSHIIIEWVSKYSIGRYLRKLAHSVKILDFNWKLIIYIKYFSVISHIWIRSDWKYDKMYFWSNWIFHYGPKKWIFDQNFFISKINFYRYI